MEGFGLYSGATHDFELVPGRLCLGPSLCVNSLSSLGPVGMVGALLSGAVGLDCSRKAVGEVVALTGSTDAILGLKFDVVLPNLGPEGTFGGIDLSSAGD